MSITAKFKQTDVKISVLQALVGGSIAVIAMSAVASHMQDKRIDELERKVEHLINDLEK